MDEQAFQRARLSSDLLPCVFEKSILAGCAQCALSRRWALAEREMVVCTVAVAQINCTTLENLTRERARFALRLTGVDVPITHAKAMRMQCGGVIGLQKALAVPANDVHALVNAAQANGASLLELPWVEIVSEIVAWQPRRRAPRQ